MTRFEAKQVAKKIAAAIEADIRDRRGLRQEFEGIDVEIQGQIRKAWVRIAIDCIPHESD